MLHLDPLAPRTPRLPHRRLGALTQLAASTALHLTLVVIAALIKTTVAPGIESRRAGPTTEEQVRHVVFLAPELPRMGGGGGGGGNQQPGPIRRAQGVGSDRSPCECEKGRRQRPRRRQLPHLLSRTFLRSHRSCSMRSRWPPACSIRLDCRLAA